jgi:hypothetical protein
MDRVLKGMGIANTGVLRDCVLSYLLLILCARSRRDARIF